ncbi:MAG TPA: alginate export family protein, partial [Gemmatimonadaceae bacterium]|nr:alginate export family protein [Gemmatimonadaceae bacterium]
MRSCRVVIACVLPLIPALAAAQSVAREPSPAKAAADAPIPVAVAPWLAIGGQLRGRVEAYHNGGFRPDNSDQYLLTRVLLHAGIRPTSKTLLFVEGMDARGPWKNKSPEGPPFRDYTDLRQLYFQIGADQDPLMFRGGRLELGFGDGRLVGALPWANTARTFDGARGMISGRGYRVDAFASSVVKVEQDKFDQNVPGNNFYGVYGSLS